MIRLVDEGEYKLIETSRRTKILFLNQNSFIWIDSMSFGEISVFYPRPHKSDCFLSVGKFRLYEVRDETDFTDHIHLELFVGDGVWQGYLLPTGLPSLSKKRSPIFSTKEIITKTNFKNGGFYRNSL